MLNGKLRDIRAFCEGDRDAVIELWRRCGLVRPWNDPDKDIDRKLSVPTGWFLVAVVDGAIIGSVMVGFDGHRGSINYLAIDPVFQRQGWGRELMREAERLLQQAGCPKINLQIRHDNLSMIEFYESAGYVEDAVVSYGKRLIEDNPPQREDPC